MPYMGSRAEVGELEKEYKNMDEKGAAAERFFAAAPYFLQITRISAGGLLHSPGEGIF